MGLCLTVRAFKGRGRFVFFRLIIVSKAVMCCFMRADAHDFVLWSAPFPATGETLVTGKHLLVCETCGWTCVVMWRGSTQASGRVAVSAELKMAMNPLVCCVGALTDIAGGQVIRRSSVLSWPCLRHCLAHGVVPAWRCLHFVNLRNASLLAAPIFPVTRDLANPRTHGSWTTATIAILSNKSSPALLALTELLINLMNMHNGRRTRARKALAAAPRAAAAQRRQQQPRPFGCSC